MPTLRCWLAPARGQKGMERGDLLSANGGIFKPQGEAINAVAADDIRVPLSATRPTPTRSSRRLMLQTFRTIASPR